VTPSRAGIGQRRRRLSRAVPWLLGLIGAALIFAAGIAVGEALHDNPRPGITSTGVTTLHP
jgi:hypothetical protein